MILPNNKNIIPVAEQVDALTTKNVSVVPTRSMPEALAALVVYDPEADGDGERGGDDRGRRLGDDRRDHAGRPRHERRSIGEIVVGDWIGSVGAGQRVTASCRRATRSSDAAIGLLDEIVGDDAELITIITGDGADGGTTAAIEGWLADHHGIVAREVQYGGQPLYPYLFGVE